MTIKSSLNFEKPKGKVFTQLKIKSSSNFQKPKGKVFTQPSKTQPDQTMSIRTIMERYASGIPIGQMKTPIYQDEELPNMGIRPQTLDLVDIQELKLKNEQDIKKLQDDAKTQAIQRKKEREAEEKEREREAAIKAFIK